MALRVLQVLPAMHEGGVERGTLEISAALVRAGHHACVVSAGGRLEEPLRDSGAQHLIWPVGVKSPLTLRWVPRLRRLLASGGIDIVHARSRLPAWLVYFAWRSLPKATRPRFVTTVHGLYSVNRYSEIMTRGERVIAVSETIRQYLHDNYPRLDMGKVQVINRGVEAAEFPRDYKPSAKWNEQWSAQHVALADKFLLLLPGRLRRLKGHSDLLKLVATLRQKGCPVHALIAGDDSADSDYIKQLKREVSERQLPITFIGYRADLKELYTVVDLVLSLSTQPESFGRTVLEPLCMGTPVVGYAQGGVGEILERMYPHGAVAPGNVDALSDKVLELIAQPRPVTSANAFPLANMQRETVALYESLAGERSR